MAARNPAPTSALATAAPPVADSAVLVTTYCELQQIGQAFARGDLNLLVLHSAPGLAKSRTLQGLLAQRSCYIEGNATPFGVYCELYRHRHEPIVLDDVDSIYQDPAGLRLLKALCQTEPVKTMSWLSEARALDREGIPRRFHTRSSVALITNHWPRGNPHLGAVADRGLVVSFVPCALEVHWQTASWFWDQEIFDFVGERLHLIARPSMRLYVLAWQLKKAGLDWQRYVLGRLLSGPALLVARLKADLRYTSEGERVRAFIAAGGGCRATYFNYARLLSRKSEVPKLVLTRRAPSVGKGNMDPAGPGQPGTERPGRS